MSDFFKRIVSAISSFFMTIAAFLHLAPAPQPVTDHGSWLLSGVPAYNAGQYCETLYDTGTGLENEVLTQAQTKSRMQLVRETTLQDAQAYSRILLDHGFHQTFSNQIDQTYSYAFQQDAQTIYYTFNARSGEARIIDDNCNTVSLDKFGYDTNTPDEPVTEPETTVQEPTDPEPIDPQETQATDGSDATQPSSEPTAPTATTAAPLTTVPYFAPDNFTLQPGVYQFCLPYFDEAHNDSSRYASNGMLYVIVLADGKVVIIDGGAPYQCADQNIVAFIRFLREITGRSTGKKIDIALWYGTHCHADHIDFFYKLIHKYRRDFRLERVMFNYQSNDLIPYATRVDKFRNLLSKYYPTAKYVKCRSGYAFTLFDTHFEILYTHEDAVSANDASHPATNANDCCSVLKMTLGGKVFLFLGDSNTIVQETLLRNYDASVLRADVLQAAHHMINNLTQLYPVIAPSYVMCPQSKSRTISKYPSYYTFLSLAPAERMYFADQGTFGFLPQNDGRIHVTYQKTDCVGYDGSGL